MEDVEGRWDYKMAELSTLTGWEDGTVERKMLKIQERGRAKEGLEGDWWRTEEADVQGTLRQKMDNSCLEKWVRTGTDAGLVELPLWWLMFFLKKEEKPVAKN